MKIKSNHTYSNDKNDFLKFNNTINNTTRNSTFRINKRLIQKKINSINSIYNIVDKKNLVNKKKISQLFNRKRNKKKMVYHKVIDTKKEINYYKSENNRLNINKVKLMNSLKKNYIYYCKKIKNKKINNNSNTYSKFNNEIIKEKDKINNFIQIMRKINLFMKNINIKEIHQHNNNKKLIIQKKISIIYNKIYDNNKFNFRKDYLNKNTILYNYLNYINNNSLILNSKIKKLKKIRLIKKNKLNEINILKNNLKNLKIKFYNLKDNFDEKTIKDIHEKKMNLFKENKELKNKINKNENIIIEKENNFKDMSGLFKNKLNSIIKDNKNIKQKIKNIILKNKFNLENSSLTYQIVRKPIINKINLVVENNFKLLKRIEFNEIEKIVKKLKYKLLIKGIQINKIINLLLKENNEFISTEELIERFRNKPFNIKFNKKVLKWSRFLIEDNSKNLLEFDISEKISINIFKSIIKNLFHPMDFPLKSELNELHKKLSLIFHKEFEKFSSYKNQLEKDLILNFKEFIDIYKKLNYKLNKKEINFLEVTFYYLFKKSFEINLMDLKILFNPDENSILNKIFEKKILKIQKSKRKSNRLSHIFENEENDFKNQNINFLSDKNLLNI